MKKLTKCLVSLLMGALPFCSAGAQEHDWDFVATGDGSTYAIEKNGSLWSWGWNESGQLGIGGGDVKISVPQDISDGHKWKFAVGGQAYAFFIREDGTLWSVGDNSKGVSGVGDGMSHKVLTQVGTDANWASVAVTRFFGHSAFGIKTDGTLWAWGEGENGSLGFGNYKNVSVPAQVGTDTDWKQVSVGQYFTVAVKTDGTLWGWGWNLGSQLLDRDEHTKFPEQLGTDNDWREVFAVAEAVYGIKNDGSLYVWGYAENGILGMGNSETTNIVTPTKVSVLNGYVHSISGSADTRVALISPDGTESGAKKLVAWGSNADGALGNGTGVPADNPGAISFISEPVEVKFKSDMDFVQLACGEGYAAILNTKGELWGWGKNRGGQLGDYSTEDQMTYVTSPVKMAVNGGETADDVFTFTPADIPASLKGARKIVLKGEWATADFQTLTSVLGNNSGFPPAGNSTLEEVDMSKAAIAEGASLYVAFGANNCGVFKGCKALKKVVMPEKEEAAKFVNLQSAFQNCAALEEIDLTGCANITSLTDAFFGCAELKTIDLSACEKLTKTESMFDKCSSLQEVILPATITLDKYAFGDCSSLAKIDWTRYSGTTAPNYPRDLFQYIEDLKAITLVVPADAYEAFMADANWSALTIEKYGSTGIQDIDINDAATSCKIYSINGQFAGNNMQALQKGVYIIKIANGNKTRTVKVVNR